VGSCHVVGNSSVQLFERIVGRRRSLSTRTAAKDIATLDLTVYESTEAWPRAFFSPTYIPYSEEKEFVDLVRNGTGGPFAAIARSDFKQIPSLKALPEQKPSQPAAPIVPATAYRLSSNTTSFRIHAPGPGIVVLTEPYIPVDFRATVNGEPSSYFRVNSAFKGIGVSRAGDYDISFSYWPASFTLSLCLAGAGVVMLGLLIAFVALRR
jgi:hypothetical protein